MAHTETLTLHIDTELKEQAANLFQELGLDLSTATGLFYRQALRRRGLPFDVRLDESNETTYVAMQAAEAVEELYGPFDSVSELMEALDA